METQQPIMQLKKKKGNKLLLLLLFTLTSLVFSAIGAGGYYLYDSEFNEDNNKNNREETDQKQAEETSDDGENADEAEYIQQIQFKECANEDLSVTSSIPTDWGCDTDSHYTNISGDIFSITMSDLGKGPYCGDEPDLENECSYEDYYENESVVLTAYYSEGEFKELFGGMKNHTAWISIQYENMETTELSKQQEDLLLMVLESIE